MWYIRANKKFKVMGEFSTRQNWKQRESIGRILVTSKNTTLEWKDIQL